jgi:hypothetical protein
MRGQLLLLALLAAPVMAQTDPTELLARVREKVLHTVDGLPRYLCTQAVDRSQYEPDRSVDGKDCEPRKLLRTTADRLRLDVSVAGRREIYSWVGDSQFGDRGLSEIVTEGSISSGSFQGFLELLLRLESFTPHSESGEPVPLDARGQNQWFARFDHLGDNSVIKSGLASKWMTVAQ